MDTHVEKSALSRVSAACLIASAIGGFICVLADLLKGDQSAIYSIVGLLSKLNIAQLPGVIILLIILPLLSVGLCYVFEPNKKTAAFVLGASVLSLALNFTPIEQFNQLKSYPNSSKIVLEITNLNHSNMKDITVTLADNSKSIVGRTRFASNENISFYLENGEYEIEITAGGYGVLKDRIVVNSDKEIHKHYALKPSIIPLNIQRIFD